MFNFYVVICCTIIAFLLKIADDLNDGSKEFIVAVLVLTLLWPIMLPFCLLLAFYPDKLRAVKKSFDEKALRRAQNREKVKEGDSVFFVEKETGKIEEGTLLRFKKEGDHKGCVIMHRDGRIIVLRGEPKLFKTRHALLKSFIRR